MCETKHITAQGCGRESARRVFLPLAAWGLACWPWMRWWAGRAGSADDLAASMLAVGTAALLTFRRARMAAAAPSTPNWFPATLAMTAFACTGALLPMTLRGLPAILALLLLPGPWRRGRWPDPAVAGLLVLALPTVMMLELFFGYPLRLLAASTAAALLHGAGVPVTREGVELVWAGAPVSVDMPCSGLRMLWSGLWLALAAAGLLGLHWRRTLAAAAVSVVVVVVANLLRVSVLCLAAVGALPRGEPLHTGVGVSAFAVGAVMIGLVIRWLAPATPAGPASSAAFLARAPDAAGAKTAHAGSIGSALYCLACLLAAALQAWPATRAAVAGGNAAFPGWPVAFEGCALRETPLTPQEAAFNTLFPGRIARFENGNRVVILRWVTQPTHRVHSAMDCLRSAGWRIEPLPVQEEAGRRWGCFAAERHGIRLRVREQCADASGRVWSDVPAWFWSAWLGRSNGPWWVVTVVQRWQPVGSSFVTARTLCLQPTDYGRFSE